MGTAGRVSFVLLCLLPAAVLAQGLIDPGEAYTGAVTEMLDRAIAEQTVFLNCSATEPMNYDLLLSAWTQSVIDTGSKLLTIGFDAQFVSDFADRASLPKMLMIDRPFADVIDFCNDHPDWVAQAYRLDYTLLPSALDGLPLGDGEATTPEVAPETPSSGKLDNAS